MRKNKKQKALYNVVNNLTYCRLKADLWAVESELAESQPLVASTEAEGIKKYFNRLLIEVKNQLRRQTVQDLSVEKEQALTVLNEFERVHGAKELSLSQDPDALKTYINKTIFKKDKYGLEKCQFALAFMIEGNRVYICPEESLAVVSEIVFDDPTFMGLLYEDFERNYNSLLGRTVIEEIGCALFGTRLVKAFFNFARSQRYLDGETLSLGEVHTVLAIKLTLLQAMKGTLPEDELKDMTDELLQDIGNLRADAEYQWLVERSAADVCKEKISRYDQAIARIGEILDI